MHCAADLVAINLPAHRSHATSLLSILTQLDAPSRPESWGLEVGVSCGTSLARLGTSDQYEAMLCPCVYHSLCVSRERRAHFSRIVYVDVVEGLYRGVQTHV